MPPIDPSRSVLLMLALIPAAPVRAAPQTEEIKVVAGMRTANGVTNTTPGGGLMPHQTAPRATSGVTRDYIAKQSPTSNVPALIASLPGVVAARSDPLGITGDQLSIRGFTEKEIGYVLDGVPVADPLAYTPYSNLFIDPENLAEVTLAQGAPDIAAPLYNAIGAQVSLASIDPPRRAGGYAELSFGNRRANKEFIRVNLGEIGNSGIRGFASFSYTGGNNWRGPGGLRRYHVDAALAKAWGDGNDAKLWFTYNNTAFNAYRNPSLAQWAQYGRSFNLSPTYTPGNTLYYKLNITADNALNIALPMHFNLGRGIKLAVTPYYINLFGPGRSGATLSQDHSYLGTVPAGPLNQPYATNGTLTAVQVDPFIQMSGGLSTGLSWTSGINTLKAGYWYMYTNHTERATYATVDFLGNVANNAGRFAILTPSGRPLTSWDDTIRQQVNALYLADTLELLARRLTLTAGLKTAMVSRAAVDLNPGAFPYKSARNYFQPLPQLLAAYRIDRDDQIYANVTTAFRAPAGSFVQLFNPLGPKPISQPNNLKAQYSIGEEIGYRHYGLVNVSVAYFHYNMTHRQVSSQAYIPGTTTLVSSSLDAGGQTSNGVEAELGLRPWHHFSPYLSGQYLHATIDNDFRVGNDALPTAGRTPVQSPKFTGTVALAYDDGRLFGNISLHYIDSQYSTFMNDQSIPAYFTSDMTLGMRLRGAGALQHPQVQLNLINVGDNSYLSGVSGFAGTAHATTGIHGTPIAAGTPTYVVGGGFALLASIATGF